MALAKTIPTDPISLKKRAAIDRKIKKLDAQADDAWFAHDVARLTEIDDKITALIMASIGK